MVSYAELAEFHDDLHEWAAALTEKNERIERALRAYAEVAKVGVFSAHEALIAELNR